MNALTHMMCDCARALCVERACMHAVGNLCGRVFLPRNEAIPRTMAFASEWEKLAAVLKSGSTRLTMHTKSMRVFSTPFDTNSWLVVGDFVGPSVGAFEGDVEGDFEGDFEEGSEAFLMVVVVDELTNASRCVEFS